MHAPCDTTTNPCVYAVWWGVADSAGCGHRIDFLECFVLEHTIG